MEYQIDLLDDWNYKKIKNGFTSSFPNPENKGFEPDGFIQCHHASLNMMDWEGISLMIQGAGILTVSFHFAKGSDLSTVIKISGNNPHALFLTKQDFPIETVNVQYWQYVTGVTILMEKGMRFLSHPKLCAGYKIYLQTKQKGKSAKAGVAVSYPVIVHNCTSKKISISVSQIFKGWESMIASIKPSEFEIDQKEKQEVLITLIISPNLVPGGHEVTKIRFLPDHDGYSAQYCEFRTACHLEHPYIYHTKEGYKDVKAKIENYPEFQHEYDKYIDLANNWTVTDTVSDKPYCYPTQIEDCLMATAYAYILTNSSLYEKKLISFYRYFCNEKTGYPARKRGCSMSFVQEGHFFQHLAIAYDILYDSVQLTEKDHENIERCFYIYMNILSNHIKSGHISNWIISEVTGALYCALAIQDMDYACRFMFGNGSIIEQFSKGMFTDGWWYECSVGYNTWVSSMILHAAHAMIPFGYNIINSYFQIPYNNEVSSVYAMNSPKIKSAMINQKWGGYQKNFICIKDLYDAVLPFLDYRGILFGISDSTEKKLEGVHWGSTYDLAYHYYKDPKYLPVIQRNEVKDPIFGIPCLQELDEIPASDNAYADNIGIVMLRSKTSGRKPREQIQAVLRYGSHGFAHGHFDITEVLSIMRFGKSFFNPEHCWWGYLHFMYKFYVQNSLTKNMVVVDRKMQIPADSRRTFIYNGTHMQATEIETTCKWSYPPYGGMVYNENETLEERCKINGCSLPIPPAHMTPSYGTCTEETEPIHQKRIMAVTDDYIVLWDYLSDITNKEHLYSSLFQIKGFQGISGDKVIMTGHTGQWTDNPISDAQFVTDCHWYQATSSTTAHFCTVFGEGENWSGERTFYNEPGPLHMDIHNVWPPINVQMVGTVAVHSNWEPNNKSHYTIPLRYQILTDNKVAASGEFGAWILGKNDITVPLQNIEQIQFLIFNDPIYNEQKDPVKTNQAIFLGKAEILFSDGERINIDSLPIERENVDEGYGIGRDYANGRVTIAGIEYPNAIPASPIDHGKPAIFTISLKSLINANRLPIAFEACIGADVFPGDESQLRKTYAIEQKAMVGRFLTVIEPYEKKEAIEYVSSASPNEVTIHLTDGRAQVLYIEDIANHVSINMKSYNNRQLEFEESTKA